MVAVAASDTVATVTASAASVTTGVAVVAPPRADTAALTSSWDAQIIVGLSSGAVGTEYDKQNTFENKACYKGIQTTTTITIIMNLIDGKYYK